MESNKRVCAKNAFSISIINSDSENILKIIKNSIFHTYIKYFNIYYHFIRNIIAKNELFIRYISKNKNFMNIFMKNLDYNKYIIILDLLHIT